MGILKKIAAAALSASLLFSTAQGIVIPIDELPQPPETSAKSALLMEATTGAVLYEKNAVEHWNPASVTKVMTILLAFEAMENGLFKESDILTCSSTAASMGGSQVYLAPGEQISVEDTLKGLVVASGNDCAVLLAETIAGSEVSFVDLMNKRAKALGMNDTNFLNCTGLDAEGHYTCAKDIAIMSRELLKHEGVFKYTTIWMDSLRNGEFGLSNTNRLIRFYEGANGLKTGFTQKALHNISATAKKDGVQMIAVIVAAPTSDKRFEDATNLLNYGFANFKLIEGVKAAPDIPEVKVVKGEKGFVKGELTAKDTMLILKSRERDIVSELKMPEDVSAPVVKGQKLGELVYTLDGKEIGTFPVIAKEDVRKLGYFETLSKLIRTLVFIEED